MGGNRSFNAKLAAGPLDELPHSACYGWASASMMRAIRAVSVERGRDPRQFALLATILKRHSGLTGVASARRRHHRSRHATAFREPAQRRTCGLRRQVRRSRPSETVRRLTAKGHARFRDTMATSRLA
jgi:N-methylhydantoinase A/oxoprolinase/acetone carboxylase beta subunit